MIALWLALGSYLVVLPATGRLTADPLLLALLVTLGLRWPRWQARPPRGVPLAADQADLRGWIGQLAGLAGRRVGRVVVVDQLDTGAAVWGRLVAVRADELAKGEPWMVLTQVARQLAAVTLPRAGAPSYVAFGLGLGVAHLLPAGWALAWVVLLGVLAMYFGLQTTDGWTKRAERRTAELIGALRQSTPEAFAALARRQGLLPDTDVAGPPSGDPATGPAEDDATAR